LTGGGGGGEGSSVTARYRDGFSECAQEVDRFLASVGGPLGHDTRYRLMSHLAACIKQQPPRPPARRTPVHPAATALGAPALNPAAAAAVYGRLDWTGESTGHEASLDGRRRSLSVAAAPYSSAAAAVFPGFVAAAAASSGRLTACPLFPVAADGDPRTAAALGGAESSSFRPIRSASGDDRCGSASSGDELEHEGEMSAGCRDEDSDPEPDWCGGGRATSRCETVGGGRPLAEKNDNCDNIARGVLDTQKLQAPAATGGVADQSVMMFMLAMNDDVKDEHVWRPW